MVTPEGKTKVLDLGLAGFFREEASVEDPRKGRIVGTADYLAPEQILSPDKVTPASDIYSLGCTLYFAVTGEVPFPGGNMQEKCSRHVHDAPLHPRRYNQDLQDPFLDLLADMMEKVPQKRLATAAEVVRRLAPWTDEAVATPIPAGEVHFARLEPSGRASQGDAGEDTRDFLEVSLAELESPSQLSQGTEGATQASQETAPGIPPPIPPPRRRRRPAPLSADPLAPAVPPWLILVAVLVGLGGMVGAFGILLWWLLS